jgi:hypothetical protein
MQCTLQVEQQSNSSESSTSQVAAGQEITGQSVSSLHRLKDINNEGECTRSAEYTTLSWLTICATSDGGFFVFGDISIRVLGRHKLNFSLFELRK